MKLLKEEISLEDYDLGEDEDGKEIKAVTADSNYEKKYKAAIKLAMQKLKERGDDFLAGEGLVAHGPKYSSLLNKIEEAKSLSLVYSQFRNVEGLGILALVLDQAGYIELKVHKNGKDYEFQYTDEEWKMPKYAVFGSNKELNAITLAIYNSDFGALPPNLQKELKDNDQTTNLRGETCRILMITQSGAEGISLKNVRQVHIMEPFWNEIRIKQVIGRAVRAESHLSLPKAEQNVQVFMYMTSFSEEQKHNPKVITSERGFTSDDHTYNVGVRKSRITNTLLDIVKASAVDCIIHSREHKNLKCAKVPKNFGSPITGLLYPYSGIGDDLVDGDLDKMMKKKQNLGQDREIGFIVCRNRDKHERRIPYYKDTMDAINPGPYDEGVVEIIGKIIINEDGNPKVVRWAPDE
jgi:hypothetical protein